MVRTGVFSLAALLIAAAFGAGEPTPPPGAPAPDTRGQLIQPGRTLVLRVRQVIPLDQLSPGERILNGRKPLVAGDRFLAEVVDGPLASQVWVGGVITCVHPPRHFRRGGHIEVRMTQLVGTREGTASLGAWRVDLDDRRLSTRLHRDLLTVLLGFDGAVVGASIGAQLANTSPTFIGGGAGVGLLVALGYAGLQRGPEAGLDPGDTFQIVVGTCSYRPLPRSTPIAVYPPKIPVRK